MLNNDYQLSTVEEMVEDEIEEIEKDLYYERYIPENNDENTTSMKRPRNLDYIKTDILVFKENVIFSKDVQNKNPCEIVKVKLLN